MNGIENFRITFYFICFQLLTQYSFQGPVKLISQAPDVILNIKFVELTFPSPLSA